MQTCIYATDTVHTPNNITACDDTGKVDFSGLSNIYSAKLMETPVNQNSVSSPPDITHTLEGISGLEEDGELLALSAHHTHRARAYQPNDLVVGQKE